MDTSPSPRFCERDRELQARYLVTMPHKILAAESGLTRQSVTALANAVWPVSAFRAAQFAALQQDYRLLSLLVERAGATLVTRRSSIAHFSTMQLLATLVLSFGRFLTLLEKIQRGERLTDEEQRALEDSGEHMKQVIDAAVEQSRSSRKPTHDTKE